MENTRPCQTCRQYSSRPKKFPRLSEGTRRFYSWCDDSRTTEIDGEVFLGLVESR